MENVPTLFAEVTFATNKYGALGSMANDVGPVFVARGDVGNGVIAPVVESSEYSEIVAAPAFAT